MDPDWNISLLIILLLIILSSTYIYLTWHHNYWKLRGVAFQRAVPLFGSMLDFVLMKKSCGIILTDIYKHSDEKVVGLFGFGRAAPWLLLRDPAIIHKVLVADFNYFSANETSYVDEELDPMVAKSLFYQKGEAWKRMRALLTPGFTAGKVRGMYPQIESVVKEFVDHVKENKENEIQLKDVTTRYTSEIVARLAYGIEGKSFLAEEPIMMKMGEEIFKKGIKDFMKFVLTVASPTLKKLFKVRMAPSSVTDTLGCMLKDVIAYRQGKVSSWTDFVQHLIEVHEKDKGFTESDIMANCLLFFVEGYETLSSVLSHLLYNLAVNPACQDKLLAEVEEAFKEHSGKVPCDVVSDLNYLNRVFLESSRVFPAIFGMTKVCTQTYSMDIGREQPLVIEKGTPVFIPTYGIHRDQQHWEDPLQFKPDRFGNNECTAFKSKGMFLPFGDGPRMCIGSRLAMMIVKLAVLHIIHTFQIVPSHRTPAVIELDPQFFGVGHKGGLYLRFIPRT